MPITVTAKWDSSDSEYSYYYYSIFVPIRYAMSKKLAHLILSSSVCKFDNFDSGYSCYCCLFVPCPWVCRSVIHFVKDVTISVCGVMGLAQVVACAFLNDNEACLDMPYAFYNYRLMNS